MYITSAVVLALDLHVSPIKTHVQRVPVGRQDMDKDNDGKISKAEYTAWWMKETAAKHNADGTFVAGYKDYLMATLVKLGCHRRGKSLPPVRPYPPSEGVHARIFEPIPKVNSQPKNDHLV